LPRSGPAVYLCTTPLRGGCALPGSLPRSGPGL